MTDQCEINSELIRDLCATLDAMNLTWSMETKPLMCYEDGRLYYTKIYINEGCVQIYSGGRLTPQLSEIQALQKAVMQYVTRKLRVTLPMPVDAPPARDAAP